MSDQLVLARRLVETEITVTAWRDPLVEEHGWPAHSDDTLVWLAPILGPSCVVVLHRLGRYAAEGDSTWEPAVLAATFGLSVGEGRNSPFAKTLARLAQFDMVGLHPPFVAVRLAVGPLPRRWIDRLPAYLADAYRAARLGS
jgi:hypothetical protein